jgi:hypothetical protein
MRIDYKNITPREACRLVEQGYELDMSADDQAVFVKKVWWPELQVRPITDLPKEAV